MPLIRSLLERRALDTYGATNTSLPYGRSPSDVLVGNDQALSLPAVWACIRVVSDDIGSLPLLTYRRNGKDRERVGDDRRAAMLHSQPHPDLTAVEFWSSRAAWIELEGNAYALKQRDRGGRVMSLLPLSPRCMVRRRDADGTAWWVYDDGHRAPLLFAREEVVHWRGPSLDGVNGLNPISYHRLTIGAAHAADEYGRRLWENDARPGGYLEVPGSLSDEAFDRLRARWDAGHRGVARAHTMAILEGGVKWNEVGITPEDSQFLATRRYGVEEIARIWRLPPHKIGALDHATFSNIEHQGIDYVTGSLRARLVRIEQRTNIEVYDGPNDGPLYSEFLVDGLLRGDITARYNAYSKAIQSGFMSPNDAARLENFTPVDGGDARYIQMNMAEITPEGLVPLAPREVP